jgi:hypothetical protein
VRSPDDRGVLTDQREPFQRSANALSAYSPDHPTTMHTVADQHNSELKPARAGAVADIDHAWPFHCTSRAPPTALHAMRDKHATARSPLPAGRAGAGSIDQPMPAAFPTLTMPNATIEAHTATDDCTVDGRDGKREKQEVGPNAAAPHSRYPAA